MVKLYTVKEMLELEKEANDNNLSYYEMMENAGKSLAEEINIAYSHITNRQILALAGSGNNGGDALVALGELTKSNWKCSAYIVKKRSEEDPLVERFVKSGGKVIEAQNDPDFIQLEELLNSCAILVDGVFGTGIKLPLKGDVARILKHCKEYIAHNSNKIFIVAVDCPSGIDCENGAIAEETIHADLTVTMVGIKSGMINSPAAGYLGKLRICNIGNISKLNQYLQNKKIVLSKSIVKSSLPERPMDAHKGTFGTALIIAGSVNYTGAALLSGMAAYRSGVGLVTLAVPAPLHAVLAGQLPESTWILLPHEMGVISGNADKVIRQNLNRASAVLIGPGFGLEDPTKEFLRKLLFTDTIKQQGEIGFVPKGLALNSHLKIDKPMVFDADGLKLLAKFEKWYEMLPAESILTPHPGEMSVLTGLSTDHIQQNRVDVTLEYSKMWGHVVVLKGAYTLIASPDSRLAVVPVATSALARAGTGDVLAGLVVGLRSQGVKAFEAACAGAWIHASAGELAAERIGSTAPVIASDVVNAISSVFSSL